MGNTTFATVTEISGQAWVRQPDGSLSALYPGTVIPPQSEVITASGASVALTIDGAAPITIGENRSVAITDDLATPAGPDESVINPLAITDSARLLAAFESSGDPFGILEATAAIAGGPGGDDGGGSFVRLLRILESGSTVPLNLNYPRLDGSAIEDLPRLSGNVLDEDRVPAPEPIASITINPGSSAGKVWESALPQGSVGSSTSEVSTSTSGQMLVTATDGISTIAIGGQTFAVGTLAGQSIPSGQGILTIVSVTVNADGTSAIIAYTYDLTAAETHDRDTNDAVVGHTIAVSVQGNNGSADSGDITITIVDDAPQAKSYHGGTVIEDAPINYVDGNVLADSKVGADGPVTWNDAANATNLAKIAQYGTLALNDDGTWQFVLNNSLQAVQALKATDQHTFTFNYTIIDADGDHDSADLTISIQGTNDAPELISHTKIILEDHAPTGPDGNVLMGATDAEGDTLTVTEFSVHGDVYTAGQTATIAGVGSLTMAANGDYTFTPVPNWNGVVAPVTYVVSDGTDTSTDTLNITVAPVNDAPVSADGRASITEGRAYAFKASDFVFDDPVDSAFADPPAFSTQQALIIDTLPAHGTLFLNGVEVTAGQVIAVDVLQAALQVGAFVYQAPIDPDKPLEDDAQCTFTFRVQDAGGTDNGGIDKSDPTTFTLTVDQFISGSNDERSTLKGGAGHDVIVGDHMVPGIDHNIALIVDLSASMNALWGTGTRLDTVKSALKTMLENRLLTHHGNINITLISFQGTEQGEAVSTNEISIEGLNTSNIDSILTRIDSLAATGTGRPYGVAFQEAKDWFDLMYSNMDYDQYGGQVFFLTDGEPTDEPFSRYAAYAALNGADVHAIGIGDDVPYHQFDSTLRLYDSTVTATQYTEESYAYVHADFANNDGVNNPDNWVHAGGGSVSRTFNTLRIVDDDASAAPSTATMGEAYRIVVTNPTGAQFHFNSSKRNWDDANDVFTWRLLKWNADADHGQGAWVVVRSGNNIGDTRFWQYGTGEYLLEFEVDDRSDNGLMASIDIGRIQLYPVVYEGQAQIVTDPADLQAVLLNNNMDGWWAVPVSDDELHGGDGNDILFGDAIHTDGLLWGKDGNPAKPADYDVVGLDALKYFLEQKLGHTPTDADLHDYITQNHALFNVGSRIHGGNDELHGGAGDDILYGQGGDDHLYGDEGNDILYGGEGNDVLDGGAGNDVLIGGPGEDILIGGPGDDVFVWLDGDTRREGFELWGWTPPAEDVIKDFGMGGADPNGNDVLDLRDLLQGEEAPGVDLSRYLNIAYDGADTLISISTTGDLQAVDGFVNVFTGVNQLIRLENVDLTGGQTDQNALIQQLIDAGKLLIDQ